MSGSDVAEISLKFARCLTQRAEVISVSRRLSWHNDGGIDVNNESSIKGVPPLVSGVHFAPYPYCYRCSFGKKVIRIASWSALDMSGIDSKVRHRSNR